MRTLSLLTTTAMLFLFGAWQSVQAQCPCPNGNNANGPFISGALMTPTVTCYEDLEALINGPVGDPMTVSAFDATDGFVPVCIVSAPPANNCVGSIMIMVDAADNDGNCASNGPFAVSVIIQDNVPPVITCPGDVTIECDESLDPMVNGNLGEATAMDNCMADVTISYSDITISVTPCETVIERTWSAQDCGGTATCVQEISVQDTQAPTFTVPADIVIYVDAACAFNADVTITGDVSDESDNCDPSVEATYVDITNPGSCVGETIVLRTWTSIDDCGNSLEQVQTITVLDNIPPVLSGCPSDVTVQCYAIPSVNDEMVTYVDNCDPTVIPVVGMEAIIPDPNNPSPCIEEILLLRTWEVADDCGNTASCTQLVTVIDTNDPWITLCPPDVTVNCEDDYSSASTGFAIAEDSCSMLVDIQEMDDITLNGCDWDFEVIRTWTATDECDNSVTCSQTITVVDNVAPVVTFCPPSIQIECDQDTSAASTGLAEGDDLCSGMAAVYWSNTINPGLCTHEYEIVRTFTLVDECGNSTTCEQTIDVVDTTPPDPTCPADEVVECDAIPVAVDPFVTDNCDTNVDIDFTQVDDLTGCGNYTGTITRTWVFTDDCGNTADCVQVLTVEDTTDPTWNQGMPGDQTVNCQSVPTAPGGLTASDNCDGAVDVMLDEVSTQGVDPTQCDYYTYTITRTWTATDDCGNETIHTQTVSVQDVTSPTFTAPLNIVAADQLSCGDENDLSLTGFPTNIDDNCAPDDADGMDGYTNGATSWTTSEGYTVSFTTFLTVPQPFVECSLSGNGLHNRKYQVSRVWTVEDPCGNSSTALQTINIIDDTPPVITCPTDVVVECSDDLSPAAQGEATATDNCDDPIDITILYADGVVGGVCTGESVITRTWTATDVCGNSSSCVQTITTEDTTVPDLTCPSNTVAECSDDLTPAGQGLPLVTDNCDMNPMSSHADVITAGGCDDEYTITRTWTATDDCGNATSCDQTINVQDTTAPTFDQSLPTDATEECDALSSPDVLTFSDNCGASGQATVYTETSTQGADPAQCDYMSYTITRTWTATDECGNTAEHVQTITVEDSTSPTFTAPPTWTGADGLECGDEDDLSITGFPTDIDDNCATDDVDGADGYTMGATSWMTTTGYTISFSDAVIDPHPGGLCSVTTNGYFRKYRVNRTWTVTDPCGNTTTSNQEINITDHTPPVITCPANTMAECSDDLSPAAQGEATATDNCDMPNEIDITFDDVTVAGSCTGQYTITRTWTAEDVCGQTSTCEQTITVVDTTPPTWDTPPADDVTECGPGDGAAFSAWLTNYAGAAATDLCSGVSLSTNGLTPTPGCGNTIVYTLNVRATDDCGNFIEENVSFTIEDTTPPDITCAADIIVECTDPTDPANTGMSSAMDNCGSVTITSSDVSTPGACTAEYVIVRTWTAQDECGLTSTCEQTITVDDSTPPAVVCPANTAVECSDDKTSGANGVATATDNCDPAPVITESDNIVPGLCADAYTIERTWTATDECGNASSCIQEITVDDTTDPVITCAANTTIECDESTDPANTGSSTATDNCDMDVTMSYSDASIPGACPQEETITRTWTATDNCGNTATCEQTIEIEDTTPPVFTTPAMDEVIECDLATNGANLTAWLSSFAGAAATDNCGSVTLTTVGLTPAPGCGNTIVYTVTIRATDQCGNFSDDPATFTIEDTTAPDWDDPMPADETVECDAIPVADVFTASDDCDNMVDVVFTESSAAGACPQEQTITRTWTATDDCGNAITHTQTITVEDSTSPTFDPPQLWAGADGLECGDEEDLSTTGFPTNIDDNCADDDVDGADGYTMGATSWMTATGYTISFSDVVIDPHPGGLCSVTSNGYFRKYRVNRTWTVTDPCGNSSTSVQEINITDHTPPVITCPADVVVECSDDLTSNAQGVATATDNCGAPITITEDDVTISGLCDGEFTIERTWTAEDECGQTADCVQTLTVEDNTAPMFDVAPMDETIECDLATNGANLTAWLTSYAGAMASDQCSAVTLSSTGPVVVDNCGETVEYTYTIIATDDCGNSIQEDATFTIIDTTVPTWDQGMPVNVTVECTAVPAVPTITATDLCDAMVDVVFTPVSTQGVDPTACDYYNYSITRTWVATDDCGNAITHTHEIVVEDTTAPTFTVPASILAASQLGCGDEDDLSLTGFPTNLADNCAPAQANGNDGYTMGASSWTTANGYTVSFVTVLTAPQPWAECSTSGNGLHNRKYHYTRTWTVEDPCGNATTANQTITIIDDTPPTWDQAMPADETVECDNVPVAPVGGVDLTATDDCDAPGLITYGYNEVNTPGGCTGEYTLTRTWTAEDVCGNAITHTQTITVEDTTIPVVTCAADVVIECDDDDQPANTGMTTAVDNCDPSPAITFLDNVVPGVCPDAWTIERTWTISDDCNNSTSCLQTITVEDTTPPAITCPADVVVECSDDLSSATQGVATATDNCDMAPVVSESDNVVPGACPHAWTIERTWTATDACGNNTSCVQTITVDDTTPPTFDLPADIVGNDGLECGDEDDLSLTGIPDNIDDNCAADDENGANGYTVGATSWMTSNGYMVEFTDVIIDPHPLGACSVTGNGLYYRKYQIERTWTITDPCGNMTSDVQLITITDHTPPVWDQPMPADETVECDAIPVAPVGGVGLLATDNCDPVVTYTDDEMITPGNCDHNYVITRTWTAEDVCGNAITHTQTITVEDTTPPTFTVPANATIQADASCTYDADPSITGDVTDEDDNCDPSLDATYTDDPQPGACVGQTIITRTWHLEDDCGNSLEQTQTITVLDEIDPVLIGCPMDETISCDDPIPTPPVVTATDNCDPSPVVNGPAEVSTQTMDGSCTDHSYTITRTWTATDGCGNSTSCEQTITVEDVIIPVITLTGPASIDLCVGDAYNDAGATAMDDCFGDLTADIVTDNPVDVNTPGTYMVTYDVEDPCGNQAVQVTRTVIVHDYPLLETSILGVVVTSNNDGMDDIAAPIEVCNAPPGNILFDSFIDLNNVPGNVQAWQTVSTVNATTAMCNNCSAPLAAFAGAVGTTTLIDPSMDGSLVMRFRAWLDLNSNNQIDPGECAGDWIEYTFIIKAEVNLTCANDTTAAACQDQATIDQAFADWLTTASFTGGKNPVLSHDNPPAPDACGGTTVVTWTVTSDCEADVTCTATFTVTEDDEDPVLTCPADLSAQCNISEQPAYADLAAFEADGGTSSDNCEVDANSFMLVSEVSDNMSCPETITRIYSVEDLCGNSATCSQTIVVDDTIEPTLDMMPADLTVECDAVPMADVISGSDNCDQMVAVTFNEVQNAGACTDSYTLVRTWTAEDDCGNTTSHVQTITVIDTTLPTWDQAMPGDETVECDAVPTAPSPITASDNCDAMVDVTFNEVQTPGNCPDAYTITRTWTASDNCGNSAVHIQTITVEDTMAPTLLAGCPADETIECDVPVPAAAVVTAEDNCDAAPVVTLDEVSDLSGCGGYTGTITRTWTAEDACGNSSDICVQVITIEDTNAPTLLAGCPADETIECDDPVPAAAVVTADDNCDPAPVVTLDEVTDLSGCGGYTGTITRTWTAEDACGNSADICTQVITVQDSENPVYNVGSPDITIHTLEDGATCPTPADISLVVDQVNPVATGQTPASFTVHGVTFETPNAAATDNCTPDGDLQLFVWAINDDFGGTADDCQRTIRVTYRLYDLCGNFLARSQDFIIIENTPPVIDCPADLVIQCDDDSSPANTGSATATDNCDADPTIGYTEVVDLSGCGGYTGTITRTWTAEDNCSNVSTCTQVITVEDTEAPTLLAGCPADETIECDVPVPAAAAVTAEDNCDAAPVVTMDEVTDLSGCGGYTGTITRTWTAEDACGNSSDICVQVITIEDTNAPTLLAGCPADETIECDDPVPAAAVVTADDNCDPAPVVTMDEVTDLSGCGGYTGTITRTWTAEDACGNSADICTQVITVQDTEIPAYNVGSPAITIYTLDDNATCPTPADISLVVDQVNPVAVGQTPASFTVHGVTFDTPNGSATDNCTPDGDLQLFVWAINDDFGGTADDCQRTIRVTYRLYDLCGNFRARSQDFIIIENTPPVIDCPADLVIQCDEDQSPANTGSATATDNCDADPTIGYTEMVDLSGCGGYTGTITRTWTAEDNCSNVSTCTQVITVEDTEAPTLLAGCPSDVTIECSDPVPPVAVVTAEDNCDPDPVETQIEELNLNGCGGYTGTITRTWTAEDACGNSADICIQVITIQDSTPPTFTTPADITIQKDVNCAYDADPSITGDVSDEADNCSVGLDATYTDDVTAGSCEGQEIITRTWRLEDNCGNVTTDIQVITAVDEILPDFPLLDDVTIYTLEDGATCPSPADIGVVVNNMTPISSGNAPFQFTIHGVTVDGPTIYSDNCSSPANLDIYVVSINPDFNGDADDCQRVIRIAYRVFDDCGNFVTRQQFFTVLDNTPPTFTVPADVTIYSDNNCQYDADPVFTGDVTDEADNCSSGLDAVYTDDVNPGTCEGEQVITRTWMLEDNCGNSVEQVQTITVQDNIPPTFTVPSDITIEKDVNCAYDADPSLTGDVMDEADNCTTAGLDATYMDVVNAGNCAGQEVITRTWTLVDDCGNTATQIQTITAVDLITPTFPKPDDVTIYTDDGATCPGVADIVLPVDQMNPIVSGNAPFNFTVHGLIQAGPTVYTDNCSLAPDLDLYIWSIDDDFGGTADACMRAIRVIYRVYDDCGNFQQRQQTFTILENTDPTFTVPADITIYKDANCNYDADPSITGDVTDEDDNCATGLDATYSDSVLPGSCEGEEIITRSWYLEDGCGNDTLQIQTITVQDNTPPTFTVPVDITIQKDVNCQYDADVSITGDVTDEADNCTLEMDATFTDVVNPGSCEGEQVITRTWFLEDDCGNTTTQVQTITAVDEINPIFPKPDDQVISTEDGATCPGTPDISLVIDQANPVASGNDPFTFFVHGIEFDGPTVYSDNCSSPANLDLYVWNINTSFMGIGDDCDRQIQVIFRVYDDCGNFQQRQQIFTISDDTPPDLSACTVPLDGTVECNGLAGNEISANDWNTANITYLYGCATDNCTPETVTSDYNFGAQFIQGCGESGTITVTYTVSDECGNETTTSATLVIEDTTGPDASNCPDLDDTFECDGAANNELAATAWDAANINTLNNCAGDLCGDFTVSSDYNYANLVGTCGEAGILTVVYTLEDECMNTSTVTAVFTIEDNVAPAFTYEPADLTINCEDSQDPLDTNGPAEASDVCDANPAITYADNVVPGACPDSYVIERTWIATDDCTNSSTYLQKITVQDVEQPEYNQGTPDVTIYTLDDNATCPATADYSLVVDQNIPLATGQTTVSFTIHGVTFQSPNGNATDNCTPDEEMELYVWAIDEDLNNDAGDCQRTIEVTWRLFDRCGNHRQRKQAFTVIENTPPVITCPANVTIDCDDDPFDLLLTGEATATDNCDPTPVVTYGDVNDLNGCSMTGTITRTWMAEDVCANTTNCTQIITVQDVDPPVLIQCDPAALSMIHECDGPAGNEAAADAWNAANIATLESCAFDVCGAIVVTSNYDFTTLSDQCGETGSLIATYTVTDECLNTSTITGTFTVVDNTVPDLSGCNLNLLNATHECDGDAGNLAAAQAWNAANVTFLEGCVTDLCGTIMVTDTFDYANLTDGCGITGVLTVTYTLTDECGNSTSTTGAFTIEDTTDPSWDSAMPADVTVECDAVPDAFVATASDGCDTDVDVVYGETRTDGVCEDTYILTRTWTATDDCSNAITHTQQIQVQDTTDPNPLCQDREIFLDENGMASITAEEVDNGSNDNCDVDVSLSLSKTAFDCDDEGPNIVTLTVTDNCGNNDNCTATVTVTDAIAPTALCKDVTVFLDQNGQGSITPNDVDNGSFDNCGIQSLVISQSQYNCSWFGVSVVTLTVTDIYDNVSTCTANVTVDDAIPPMAKCKNYTVSLNGQGQAVVTEANIDNGSTDNCYITSYTLSKTLFTCDDLGANAITLTVTDLGGNTSSCAATVTVEDNLPPVMACKDLTVFINAQGDPITIFPNQIDAGSADNCEIVSLTLNKTTFDCSDIGQNVVNLVAEDPSGNINNCSAIVTVVDAIPPVWTYMPGDITVNCIDVLDDEPEAADNCGGVNINWSDVQELWPAGPMGSYLVRRTWTAFDASGNEISYEQVVYVLPGGELLINCSPDIVTQPTHFPIKVDWPIPSVDDICEGSVDMVQIGGPPPLSYFNPGSQTLITYEHVDFYGTHYQCSFWVNVPLDGSGYIVVLNEVDCEDLSLTDCEVMDLPSPDNYSFEYILPNMAPIPFDIASGGRFEMFADGSAHLTGSWSDFPNTCGWDMDIWFHRRRTHDGWVAAGGDISAFSGLGDPTLWEFFEVDASRSKMSGTGCYTGQNYNVRISPNFPKFGFQLGEGANTKTNAYGGWVILGITNQSDQLVAQGIFSFELDCTTTNLIKDAAEVISLDGFDYPVVWSTGTTGPELGDVAPGMYDVTVTDQVGNTQTTDFDVIGPKDCILYYEDACRPGNMTENALAKQSSTFQGAVADRAIDQNTDGDFANGSVSSTLAGFQNYLSLAYIEPLPIEQIRIWNRTDCCGDVLDPFYVFVSETPIPDNIFPEDLVFYPEILAFYHDGPLEDSYTFDVGEMGQYIKVQLAGSGRLMLAEVQVLVCQEDAIGLQDDGFTQPDDQIIVEKPEVDLSVDEVPSVTYWPNPANNYLEIDITQHHASPMGLTIVNMQGVEVYRAKLPADHLQHLHIDTGDWGPGIYFMTISSANGARSLPLTIQH